MPFSEITKTVVTASLILFLWGLNKTSAASEEGSAERTMPLAPGFHQLEFSIGGGDPLRSSVWVPEIREHTQVPLVVALHWGGEVTPWFGAGILRMLAVPAFEDLDAIIVAPDCPGNGWSDPTSERHVLALLKYAVGKWPVDSRRIAITGYSMGGQGCWYFASRHPNLFSAAVPVAGRPVDDEEVRVPVYAINGRRDEIIELAPTQRAIDEMRARGVPAELVVVNGLTHYETGKFVTPLKKAAKWLRKLWETDS